MMVQKYYQFAGVSICVCCPEDMIFADERHLAPFARETLADPHVFRIAGVQQLSAPVGAPIVQMPNCCVYASGDEEQTRYYGSTQESWTHAYMRVGRRGKDNDVQLKNTSFSGRIGAHTVLGALGAEHLVVRAGGVILHASYVVWQGKAILFTAPSETGKSTQAELWRSLRGARIINGDRAAVRIEDGQAVACGIPFAGSSQYCENVTAPLGAIVYLGQAPQTVIRPLTGFRAFRAVWEGCSVNTWDQTDMELATGLVQRVLESVPVFRLDCTPDGSAVSALEEALRKR